MGVTCFRCRWVKGAEPENAQSASLDGTCPAPPPEFRRLPVDDQPVAYRADLAAWKEAGAGQIRGRETQGLLALKPSTHRRYEDSLSKCLGVVVDHVKIRPAETFGARMLTKKPLVTAVLAVLDTHQARSTVAGTICALLRLARDLLGNDPDHAEDIKHLSRELVLHYPNSELSTDELLELDNIAHNRHFAPTLRMAPDAIVERSKLRGLSARDSLARVAAGFAVELKLSHTWLMPAMIVRIDMEQHIQLVDEKFFLIMDDASVPGGTRHDPLTETGVRVLNAWHEAREKAGVSSTLLFPSRHSRLKEGETRDETPQAEQGAMEFVVGELEAVMGQRLTVQKLKNIIVHVAVKRHPDQVEAIAQAVGTRDSRDLARKFRPVIERGSQ